MPINKKNIFFGNTHGREIDLRAEFLRTMYGGPREIPKSQKGLQRVFRNEKCPCVDKVTGEPDRESRCPICLGEGNLWDEKLIDFYHKRTGTEDANVQQDVLHKPGLVNTETEVFYVPYQFNLTKSDKIVILTLDKEGIPTTPLKRLQLFRIAEVRPYRLDNGRLEFWEAFCYEDNNKYL